MGRMLKMRLGDLKRALLEEFLRESEGELPSKETKEDGEESIDKQVDRYLAEYESEAKSSKNEGLDWRRSVRRLVEDAEDSDEGDDKKPDDEDADEPKKISSDEIDVDSFTNSVMRLVDNYDSLLEMRNTLLRRAANFLGKNYDPEVIENFKDALREQHGIEIGKSQEEASADNFPAPAADRAGSSGGGA